MNFTRVLAFFWLATPVFCQYAGPAILSRGEEMVRHGRSAGWFRVLILNGRSLPRSTAAQSICGRFQKNRIFSITPQR